MQYCTFIPGDINLSGHKTKLLEITCDNGYVGVIYVTEEPPFQTGKLCVWHYSLSADKTRISLFGIQNNSVNFAAVDPKGCHPTIENWELKEYAPSV